jgi:hypothetical protein
MRALEAPEVLLSAGAEFFRSPLEHFHFCYLRAAGSIAAFQEKAAPRHSRLCSVEVKMI